MKKTIILLLLLTGTAVSQKVERNTGGFKFENDVTVKKMGADTITTKKIRLTEGSSLQGKVLTADDSGYATWRVPTGGGGDTTFLDLSDTPPTYSGQGGSFIRISASETKLEFVPKDSVGNVVVNEYPVQQSLTASFDANVYNYNNYTVDTSWTNLNMNGDPTKKFTNVRVSSTSHIWGKVTAISKNGYEQATYDVWAQTENIGGVLRVKTSEVTPKFEDDPSWDFRFAVEDTTKIVNFQAKGTNTDTIFWSAQFNVTESYYLDPQSNWTPLALLGADSLLAWYDASQHTTKFTESLNDTTWVIPDMSGLGNHAVRTTTPKYVYRDSCYYGDPATSFGGYQLPTTSGVYANNEAHIFVVGERSVAGGNGVSLGGGFASLNGFYSPPGLGDGFVRVAGVTTEVGIPFTGTSGRNFLVETIVTDSLYAYVNTIAGGIASAKGSWTVRADMFIMNSSASPTTSGFRGNLKEMIIVRGKTLDAPTRQKIVTYLRSKHKI